MTTKSRDSAANSARCQTLTRKIKEHAKGARNDVGHPARVKHAIECGKALTALKKLLAHGGWSRWVEQRCRLNRMTANRYIRLANYAGNVTRDMSIREAYIAAGVITLKPRRG